MSRNTTSQPYTEEQFLAELSRFRQDCGTKAFWQRPRENREAYLQYLAHVYLNVDNADGSKPTPEQLEKWAAWFENASANYHARELYML